MECGRMKTTTVIIVALVALLMVVCVLTMLPGSRTSDTEEPRMPDYVTTAKGIIPVPGTAYMDGTDTSAGITVKTINIWNSDRRWEIACTLAHGERVHVVAAEHNASEGRYYFHVRSGGCDGWVSEPFVSAR